MTLHLAARSREQTYGNLPAGMRFKVHGSSHTFIKLAQSHALDQTTDKDAIFALYEPCKQEGWQEGYYPVWNLL